MRREEDGKKEREDGEMICLVVGKRKCLRSTNSDWTWVYAHVVSSVLTRTEKESREMMKRALDILHSSREEEVVQRKRKQLPSQE
jgi:hypothetical protein